MLLCGFCCGFVSLVVAEAVFVDRVGVEAGVEAEVELAAAVDNASSSPPAEY